MVKTYNQMILSMNWDNLELYSYGDVTVTFFFVIIDLNALSAFLFRVHDYR